MIAKVFLVVLESHREDKKMKNDLFAQYVNLLSAIIRQAAEDYLSAKKSLENPSISATHRLQMERRVFETRKFFEDNPYSSYLDVDGRYLLGQIEKVGIGEKVNNATSGGSLPQATDEDRRRVERQNRLLARQRKKGKSPPEQPCWTCAKACDGNACCWARGVPRADWKAKKIEKITSAGKLDFTYAILKCPAYEREV